MNEFYDLCLKHNTDKLKYADLYYNILSDMRLQIKSIFEIGVYRGASLKMWREYCPNAKITAIDSLYAFRAKHERRNIWDYFNEEELKFFNIEIMNQTEVDRLSAFASKYKPYDLIIDDGEHSSSSNKKAMEILYPLLRPKGIYIIEDAPTRCYYTEWVGNELDNEMEYITKSISIQQTVECAFVFRKKG
jgi:predicted O-methyltransferase YrrM